MELIVYGSVMIFLTPFAPLAGSTWCLCGWSRVVRSCFYISRVAVACQFFMYFFNNRGFLKDNGNSHSPISRSLAFKVPVYQVVLVDYVNSFSLDREFYVDCTSAVVSWFQVSGSFGSVASSLQIVLFLFVAFPIPVLKTVLTDITKSDSITASLCVVGTALRVLEPIGFLDGCYNRPIQY